MRVRFCRLIVTMLAALGASWFPAGAEGPTGFHDALERLSRQGSFSGAVVVQGPEGVLFSRGYGWADPFERRAFSPDTQVDSGSLAKPVTAAAVLLLVREGKIDLDAPVQRYLPEFVHSGVTVRHLLSHSAGLEMKETPEALAGKSNAQLLAESPAPRFAPGTAFSYCNLCYAALAEVVERAGGLSYLDFARTRLALPAGVTLRPARLAAWTDRAVGYRRGAGGALERFDSWEGELLYGPANLSLSASQLAEWGRAWLHPSLDSLRRLATSPAPIGEGVSGLTLGNWYCDSDRRRCHYLGHHEGFHHMLYWDAERRIVVAMTSNNALAPALQQPLQRAVVAFASGEEQAGRRELRRALGKRRIRPGRYVFADDMSGDAGTGAGPWSVHRDGLTYPAYPLGDDIRYVPGLDGYLAGDSRGQMRWLSLYEDRPGVRRGR